MKFEQAFYTVGENHLSNYRKGFGICASSNEDKDFIEKCMGLGAKFDPEPGDTRAEFILYSDTFKNFVGVKISPGKQGMHKRNNILCHMFIPAKDEGLAQIQDYLINYPFLEEIEDRAILEAKELKSRFYDVQSIAERYGLNQPAKMASLLYIVFPCIFQEKKPVYVVIDLNKHDREEASEIAREITCLLAYLLPDFLKQLSFGIYTIKNTSQASFIYTDQSITGRYEFLLDAEADCTDVPDVYCRMAEFAVDSIKKGIPFTFADELFNCGKEKEPDYHKLSLFYLKWKLKHKERVSYQEIEDDLGSILYIAKSNKWYRDFLLDYLSQTEEITLANLEKYNNIVMPMLSEYEQLTKEERETVTGAAVNLIQKMYQMDNPGYKNAMDIIRKLPEKERSNFLEILYDQEKSFIKVEENQIKDVASLLEYWERYKILNRYEPFQNAVFEIATGLYEAAERKDRNSLTNIMKEATPKQWENMIEGRLRKYMEISEYIAFLGKEYDKMESCYAESYCVYMLELVDSPVGINESVRKTVKKAYNKIREIAGEQYISDEIRKEYSKLSQEWDVQDAKEEGRRLLKEAHDLEGAKSYFVFMEKCSVLKQTDDIGAPCEKYRSLLEEYPDFTKIIKDNSDSGLAGRAGEEWERMRCFFDLSSYKVVRNRLTDALELLKKGKSYFGEEEREIRDLEEAILKEMDDIKIKYDTVCKRIEQSASQQDRNQAAELADAYNQAAKVLNRERLYKYIVHPLHISVIGRVGR